MHGPLATPVDGERTVTHLPPVTVGTVEHARPPQLGHAFDIREAVPHAVCEQQPAAGDTASIPEIQLEPTVGKAAGGARRNGAELDRRIRHELLTAEPSQVRRRGAVTREKPVHLLGHGVGRRIGIEDEHPPPHPSQHERRAQARRARPHNEDIEWLLDHRRLLAHTV